MKGKHFEWIVSVVIVGLMIHGVLSEKTGSVITEETTSTETTSEATEGEDTEITTPKETKSEAAEGDDTNIPVDPGGLQSDSLPGAIKGAESVKTGEESEEKKSITETANNEEESKQRSMDKDVQDSPSPTLLNAGSEETTKIANGDGQKNDQENQRESITHVAESASVKSDDQTEPDPKEAEDLKVTPTSEDTPAAHIPEVPLSEVVDSSTEIKGLDTNKSDEKDDPEPVPADPEFQTFTEFFEQNKQAEEEKKKQSKLADLPGTEGLQMKQQKRVVNVASRECGAKIISSNPEVENPAGVLTSNKDDYMINPCKAAKKWFVIELCEPARVKSLEVASFELFSSQPRTFRVQFSEGYPTKDWQVMEPFSANEARAVQAFTVPDDFNDYVKFVRVEMLDHFGEEHFCPLTIFRVLGVLVEYDAYMGQQIDDTSSDMDSAIENDIEDMEGDSDGPKNLFASATESMIKIVKKVLNVEDKPNTEDLGLNETININDTDKVSALPANVTSDGYMLPCVPGHSEEEVSKQSSTIDQPNTSILGGTGTNMQTATASMDVGTDEQPVDKSASIVTKLEDHEQVPSSLEEQPIVTLLDREESEVSLSDLITKCLTKAPRKKGGSKHRLTSTKRASAFCTYVQILLCNTRPETCSVKRIPPAGKAEVGGKDIDTHSSEKKVVGENNFIIVTKDVLLEASTIPTSVSNDTGSSSPHPTPSSQSTPVMSNYSPIDKSADTSTVTNVIEDLSSLTQISEKSLDGDAIPKMSVPDATVTTIDIEPSKVLSHEEISTTINPVSVEESQKSEINGQKTLTPGEITLDPSIVSSSAQVDSSHTTPALDSVTVTGSKLEEGKSSESFTSQRIESQEPKKNDQNPNAEMEVTSTKLEIVSTKVSTTTTEPLNTSDNLEMFDSDAEVMSSIVDKLASAILDDPQNGHSRIINDTVVAANATQKSSGMPQKDLGLVNVKVPVLPHSKREIALMRLANRINALEMNVTLSIRFLERMSQKFKTKSDEMIKALNRTDTKLEETIQEAATRGEKQQEDMKRMEMKLKNLTVMMEEMIHNMDTLNQKVTDRQMVWTSVEVIILVIIFMVCLRRGKSPSYIPMPPEVQKILDKFPSDMDLTALPRRNSFHGTIQHSSVDRIGGSLQKYNSETALSCSQDISGYDPGGATNISSCSNQQKDMPKRKKRKKKSPDIKISGISDRLKHHSSLPESHTNINSAGLLFGASSEETTVCENLDRTSSEGTKWTLPSDNKLVCKSEVEPVYCKSDSSDTSVTSKGQESKVRVSYSSSDIPDCVPEGSTKLTKVKAHSFTSELPVSVISSKPPKCPVAPGQVVGKSKRGSPPMMRALADPGGGGGGASKKKRHSYGHHILLDYNTQAPAEVETVRPNINGNHISTSQTATSEQQNNRQPQQHRPKRKSHTRAASDDLSSVPDTSTASWKNMFRWK